MAGTINIVSGIFPPDAGGPAKFSADFYSWSHSRGESITVITYSDFKLPFIFPRNNSVFRVDRRLPLIQRYVKMLREIRKQTKQGDSILAVGAFLETYFASLVFGLKYVAKVPGDIVWERARNRNRTKLSLEDYQNSKLTLRYRIFRFLFSQSLRRASIVIVPSEGLYNFCLSWGVPERKLRLIFNSVNIEECNQVANSPKEFDLVTVCRLAPWKGVDEIIEYSAKQGRTLLVIGDGPERKNLEKLARDLNAPTTFIGQVENGIVLKHLTKSKIFVLNSHYEGLPHALIEARATGVICAARVGTGSAEVIKDASDGYLISNERPLEETLEFAFKNADDWSFMSEKASMDVMMRFDREKNFELIRHELLRVSNE